MNYELYVVDTETSGLSCVDHSPIEISIYRLSTDEQKTWQLKPINLETISDAALRVNGHKLEDLKGKTSYGREIYKDPSKVLVEIEDWVNRDGLPSSDKILVGQNVKFDKDMLLELWKKCGTEGTFPFNDRHTMDTMILEFAMDYAKENMAVGYSLNNLCKKYGVKNKGAHTAEADTFATMEVFKAQIEFLKKALKG